ncbi:restriction endonuclease subunit S [Lysinibacillus sphaericus]|uniref:restriction endonuclease subunit S n=1 Tax=Lysinibacillus sphaericus TaxID=1421 RepID=UPI000C1859D0|nr:restriction endonuclease subunit S [Lysinibacillus sphaericus]PIJ96756.1 restriction endonuclease subunit S [Lysinibacillus sphaericus]
MGSKWEVKALGDILDINPTIKLPKGTEAKKVAMEYVAEYTKKIQGYEITPFTSGSKFKNNDTIMARITPCLENGKTAFVDILEEDEIAFGSTEFFVLRAKEGIADPQFIYYLAISEELRTVAIKSMTGTSGRQRAQKESILEYKRPLPSIEEQEKIGSILSLFDKKIENNKNIIRNLELTSNILFKRWFIDFEFPNEQGLPYRSSGGEMVESELGGIPKYWEIANIKTIATKVYAGGTPSRKKDEYWLKGNIPWLKTKEIKNNVIFNTEEFISLEGLENSSAKWIPPHSIVVAMYGATAGQLGYVSKEMTSNQACCAIVSNYPNFIFNYLKSNQMKLKDLATGSAQQNLNKEIISNFKIILCDIELLNKYEKIVSKLRDAIINLSEENYVLEELCNTLLPKLLSGEIEIPVESVVES